MVNSTLLAIPAYYVALLAPHIVASHTVMTYKAPPAADDNAKAKPRQLYDNVSPRGAAFTTTLRAQLDPATYAFWERAKAAHNNGLEAFPLFVAAVLAAQVAGLRDAPGVVYTTWATVGFRALYAAVYLATPQALPGADKAARQRANAYGLVRSLVWFAATLCPLGVLLAAGLQA